MDTPIAVWGGWIPVLLLWLAYLRGRRLRASGPAVLLVVGLVLVLLGIAVRLALPWVMLRRYFNTGFAYTLLQYALCLAGGLLLVFGVSIPKEPSAETVEEPRSRPGRRLVWASFWLFLAGGGVALSTLVSWGFLPDQAPDDWETLGATVEIFVAHAALTGLCWSASVVCGLLAVRQRAYALWWVIPELLLTILLAAMLVEGFSVVCS